MGEKKTQADKCAVMKNPARKNRNLKTNLWNQSMKDSTIEVEIQDISSLKKGDVVKTLLGSMFYKIEHICDYGFCIEENTVGGMDFIVSNEIMRNYFKKVVPFTEAVKEKQENSLML